MQTVNISTFNVQILSNLHHLSELSSLAASQDIDVICIQEHCIYHGNLDRQYQECGKEWTMISASSWKNSINSIIGVVGMLLSPHTMKALNCIEKVLPRIIVAAFNGNLKLTIISCYNPTNVLIKEDVT